MGFKLFQVDTFTRKPFSGNPAAVCFLPELQDKAWMQSVAAEINLSETAFLSRNGDRYDLRWFTPVTEVDLCGHATLASAHLLWEEDEVLSHEPICFNTKSGLLTASKKGNQVEINLPQEIAQPVDVPSNLAEALGITPKYVGKNRFDYLVVLDSEESLRALNPDFPLLATIPARGVIVTSKSSTAKYDFVSRFFSPAEGIDEDPVTGSAHCCLGPYWQTRFHKDQFTAYQASQRGGVVDVQLSEDRVYLRGEAVTILRGELLL